MSRFDNPSLSRSSRRAPSAPTRSPATADATGDARSDDQLMRAFADGEAGAFDALYQRHHRNLYRFVRRVLGTSLAAQVDEVFQDTWMRLVQSPDSWQPQGASFRTWLFTVAHNRAIDQLRRGGREVSIDPDPGDDERAPFEPASSAWDGWPEPAEPGRQDDLVFWRAAGSRLLACLDQLPGNQRSIFLLHHEDGIAVDELARSLNLGFETAKSRLRYAMSKLRTCMGAYLPGDQGAAPCGPSAP